MEKQIKVIICSEDGEWGRGPIQKLAQKGAQALFAPRDGKRLLEVIREEKPQIVLMELFMPGLDAIGVIHAVAQDASLEKPMYIVTASYATPMLEREVLAAGAAHFALSPFDQEEMAQRMLSLYTSRAGTSTPSPSAPACGCRSPRSSTRSASPPTSRATTTCGTPSSWPSRTRRSSTP